MERAARRSRGAHAVVRRGGRRIHPLRDRRRVRPRRTATRASSAASHRPRYRRRSSSATRRQWRRGCAPSGARDAAGRTAELGAAALRVPHLHARDTPARVDGLVAIARRLCALGANPNAEYHWNWHPELPRTVLWAAICAVAHLPLAEVLLEAGANPTDGVSAHIAGGGGNIAALELLHRFGVNVNGIPGGVPPLVYMMTGPTIRRSALAARTWRGSESRVGRRRRSAAARRGSTMGRADGRAARRARR